MDLIKNFGVQVPLLIAQVINFLIILYLLKRFMYKPVLELLKNREATIREGLKQAEESRLLLEQSQEKEKDLLKKAQLEARQLLQEAKAQTKEMLEKSEATTRKHADAMLQEAREQIARDAKDTEKRLATHVTELAMELLQSSLSGVFSEKDQEIIMENTLKRMKGNTN